MEKNIRLDIPINDFRCPYCKIIFPIDKNEIKVSEANEPNLLNCIVQCTKCNKYTLIIYQTEPSIQELQRVWGDDKIESILGKWRVNK